ncbi:MAG: carboxyl transferase domain-containing protein [Thermodesulfobacteriota bacterium]
MDYEEGRKKLEQERLWVQEKSSQKQLERHRKKRKYHVSERIEKLVDPGSWLEYGQFARSLEPAHKERSRRDAVMTGLGKINGRTIAILGDDITSMGATQSFVTIRKSDRIIDIACRNQFPIISFSEGGGGRVPDIIGVGFSRILGFHRLEALNSLANWEDRPLFICCVFGYCYGDPAFRSGMADITIMVEDSAVAVSGPPLLEVAISEKITDIELGGPEIHQTKTGLVDIVVKTEDDCIEAVKNILHILRPPEIPKDPVDRLVPSLEAIIPHSNRYVYDMRKVIDELCDNGEWLELKPRFGKGLLVGLARVGGQVVGIIASQPLSAGGSVDARALQKSAAFLEFTTRRRIPLIVVQDIPGFLIGSDNEKDGMVNEIANHTKALDKVDVPMIVLIIRKSYGAAYYFLGCVASGAQYVAAWPNAEISFMAPEMGAGILTKHVEPEKKEDAMKKTAADLERNASVWGPAHEFLLDDIIAPEETRKMLCHALSLLATKAPGPLV